jgi:hypothetical protein
MVPWIAASRLLRLNLRHAIGRMPRELATAYCWWAARTPVRLPQVEAWGRDATTWPLYGQIRLGGLRVRPVPAAPLARGRNTGCAEQR